MSMTFDSIFFTVHERTHIKLLNNSRDYVPDSLKLNFPKYKH